MFFAVQDKEIYNSTVWTEEYMQRTDNSGFQSYRSKQVHKMPWYENAYESSIIDSHLLYHCM
jgi:hypothetical protein